MKRVFGMVEAVFDAAYLLAAGVIGCILLCRPEQNAVHWIAGGMALILGFGDAFHLVPRIQTIWTGEEARLRKALGRGKQITSITMTLFYLLLWQLGEWVLAERATVFESVGLLVFAILRIGLCLLPQNRWTDRYPPVSWSILRNVPFFLIGILVAGRFFLWRASAGPLGDLWLAIVLSFACYLPVVLFVHRNPKLGMLMLPKTCLYLWMLVMCLSL